MTEYIVCYDLKETNPKPHGEFLTQAKKHGWSAWITAGDKLYHLPNTTLTGAFGTIEAAVKALNDTRAATQAALGVTVTLEKWYIAPVGAGKVVSDDKKPK